MNMYNEKYNVLPITVRRIIKCLTAENLNDKSTNHNSKFKLIFFLTVLAMQISILYLQFLCMCVIIFFRLSLLLLLIHHNLMR